MELLTNSAVTRIGLQPEPRVNICLCVQPVGNPKHATSHIPLRFRPRGVGLGVGITVEGLAYNNNSIYLYYNNRNYYDYKVNPNINANYHIVLFTIDLHVGHYYSTITMSFVTITFAYQTSHILGCVSIRVKHLNSGLNCIE